MPGQISTVTVTGSTSVVWAVCLEAVPGRCMRSVSGAHTRLCVCTLSSGLEIIEQNTFYCFVYTTNPLF